MTTSTLAPIYPGVDGAFPGSALPSGTRIVAGYVGATDLPGPPDTPHIWTLHEWNSYEALDDTDLVRALPIYVHDFPGDPRQDAQNAVDAVTDLGWKPNLDRIIAWDAEQLIDPQYAQELYDNVYMIGRFLVMKYGPLSTTFQNPPAPGGTWLADYNFTFPPKVVPPNTVGVQWRAGNPWDRDVFGQFVWDRCGRGDRQLEP